MARSVRRLLAVAGNPDNGRLGISKNAQLLTVVDALLDVNIKKISCGAAHTAIVAGTHSIGPIIATGPHPSLYSLYSYR